MDNNIAGKVVTKITLAIIAIALVDLIFVNWWIVKKESKSDRVKESEIESVGDLDTLLPSPSASPQAVGSPAPQDAKAVTSSPSPVTAVQTTATTVVQTANKEIFISMGSGSTKSKNYADLNGTDVTIDTTKYSAIETITFEASIWVEGGNGRAYAQIYNVDDKNPYIESVISNNVSTPTVKGSGSIPFPSGRKTYRVQAKTDLEQYPAHVENARIKIVLK